VDLSMIIVSSSAKYGAIFKYFARR
jgi:hypothetical protein